LQDKRAALDLEIAQHFRDELRDARAVALKDAEAFEQLIFVFERLGVYLSGRIGDLGRYAEPLTREALRSPLAHNIPAVLPDWHADFSTLYQLVRTARNDAMHEGAYARHLTKHAVELSIVLEDALMAEAYCARDFMVGDPVCAYSWQPISSIRRSMLVNAFSFLPLVPEAGHEGDWKLLSDYSIATYLRASEGGNERNRRLAQKLSDLIKQDAIELTVAPVCGPEEPIATVIERSQGRPVLVIGSNRELRGILTPFDLL